MPTVTRKEKQADQIVMDTFDGLYPVINFDDKLAILMNVDIGSAAKIVWSV